MLGKIYSFINLVSRWKLFKCLLCMRHYIYYNDVHKEVLVRPPGSEPVEELSSEQNDSANMVIIILWAQDTISTWYTASENTQTGRDCVLLIGTGRSLGSKDVFGWVFEKHRILITGNSRRSSTQRGGRCGVGLNEISWWSGTTREMWVGGRFAGEENLQTLRRLYLWGWRFQTLFNEWREVTAFLSRKWTQTNKNPLKINPVSVYTVDKGF